MAARNLLRTILESHGAAGVARGDEIEVEPDHVLAGGVAAVVTLAGFEALGRPRISPDVAVVGAERHDPSAAFEAADELRELQDAAARAGAMFVRPGDGRCEQVHLELLAAPGRVLLSAGRRAPVAGALGMLVLPCGAIEAAAALGGRTLERRWPGEFMVEFQGRLPEWADGHDVICALIQRLGPEGAGGRWIEAYGEGLKSLDSSSRIWIARNTERLRAPSALFPSDEITRAHLAACQRDADWRRFVLDRAPAADAARSLDLSALEPMSLAHERAGRPRQLREDRGLAIGTVLIGSGAGVPDLARLDAMLAGHGVHASVTLQIALGSRQVRATTETLGALGRLRAAGAQIIEGAVPPTPASTGLAFGVLMSEWPPGRTAWRNAGLAACAVAARTGAIGDPRDAPEGSVPRSPLTPFALAEPLRPAPLDIAASPGVHRLPLGRALEGPLRGSVLLRVGDRVNSEQVLPWGARVRSLVGDFAALSEHAFAGLDPTFAARARARDGGFVVAGDQFGEGVPWDTAALVLVQLGIRAVIARSIQGDFERVLAQAGIMPLRWASANDGRGVQPGDELELPGVPETFIAGRPIVARNLTQGTQYTLRHSLGPRDVERLRSGGLLADIGRPR
jgi:aconitate hydratase